MDIIEKFVNLDISGKIQFIFIVIAFVFMVFSFLGWILELFYRRFCSQKKWVNPGFLRGPYLPIYGIGVVLLTAFIFIMTIFENVFFSKIIFHLVIIIGIGILMTIIELIAGLIFIKKMNIRLWDYSDCKFNFQGIICLKFSIYWTILGAIFYLLLFNPIVNLIISFITLDWIMIAVFLMGIFYGIFIIDLINSLNILNKIKAFAKENGIILKIEKFKLHIKEKIDAKEYKFLSPFKSNVSIKEHLKSFIIEQKDKIERIRNKKK